MPRPVAVHPTPPPGQESTAQPESRAGAQVQGNRWPHGRGSVVAHPPPVLLLLHRAPRLPPPPHRPAGGEPRPSPTPAWLSRRAAAIPAGPARPGPAASPGSPSIPRRPRRRPGARPRRRQPLRNARWVTPHLVRERARAPPTARLFPFAAISTPYPAPRVDVAPPFASPQANRHSAPLTATGQSPRYSAVSVPPLPRRGPVTARPRPQAPPTTCGQGGRGSSRRSAYACGGAGSAPPAAAPGLAAAPGRREKWAPPAAASRGTDQRRVPRPGGRGPGQRLTSVRPRSAKEWRRTRVNVKPFFNSKSLSQQWKLVNSNGNALNKPLQAVCSLSTRKGSGTIQKSTPRKR